MTDLTPQQKRYLEEIRRTLEKHNKKMAAQIPKINRQVNENGDNFCVRVGRESVDIPIIGNQLNSSNRIK